LGVSYTSVHRIMNGKRPCKSNRPKERAKMLDDFDHCVIKRTIHGLYSRKIGCLLIYPIKWNNWLLRCLFLTKKGKQLFYKLLAFRKYVRLFTHFTKNAKYNNILWEKCLSGSSKVHVAERKTLQVRYLTYGWLFYKVHLKKVVCLF
jgi:hypothetical protein